MRISAINHPKSDANTRLGATSKQTDMFTSWFNPLWLAVPILVPSFSYHQSNLGRFKKKKQNKQSIQLSSRVLPSSHKAPGSIPSTAQPEKLKRFKYSHP